MIVLRFLLDLYFAAILGVSGLTKLRQPGQFAHTLRRQRILPKWSINGISQVFPYLEITVAAFLVTGVAATSVALVVTALFAVFLGVEVVLLITKRTDDCGCYGTAYMQKVDIGSFASSTLLLGFAMLHLWLVLQGASVEWQWRLAAGVLLGIAEACIAWRTMRQRRLLPSIVAPFTTSRLHLGDPLPLDIGIDLPSQAIILFLSSNCKPCLYLSQDLASTELTGWSLIMVSDRISSQQTNKTPSLVIPSYARYFEDPEDRWFHQLGCTAKPVALAFIDGRLVSQRIGPKAEWIANPPLNAAIKGAVPVSS